MGFGKLYLNHEKLNLEHEVYKPLELSENPYRFVSQRTSHYRDVSQMVGTGKLDWLTSPSFEKWIVDGASTEKKVLVGIDLYPRWGVCEYARTKNVKIYYLDFPFQNWKSVKNWEGELIRFA